MMFEPGLTEGTLEVLVAPSHHPYCSADDQSTKAIDIQNAYLNGKPCHPQGKGPHASLCWAVSPSPKGACAGGHLHSPKRTGEEPCKGMLGVTQDRSMAG